MNDKLSIVIPTVNYSSYLDLAISSSLKRSLSNTEIVVHINNVSQTEFHNSKFWGNSKIRWHGGDYDQIMSMDQSICKALTFSTGSWMFLLSDDDMLGPNFLEGISLKDLSQNSLYMTTPTIINEENEVLRHTTEVQNRGRSISRTEALELFFNRKMHNNLSLFLFSKNMYEKVGPYRIVGYPNGYYMDTVMHGKFVANCDQILTGGNIVFYRRESGFQESSKFYFEEVNDFFKIIVENLFSDENFQKAALEKYGQLEDFKRKMIQDRFKTEWNKLNKPVYNIAWKNKMQFLFLFYTKWGTGIKFKFYSTFYIFFLEVKGMVPEWLKRKLILT